MPRSDSFSSCRSFDPCYPLGIQSLLLIDFDPKMGHRVLVQKGEGGSVFDNNEEGFANCTGVKNPHNREITSNVVTQIASEEDVVSYPNIEKSDNLYPHELMASCLPDRNPVAPTSHSAGYNSVPVIPFMTNIFTECLPVHARNPTNVPYLQGPIIEHSHIKGVSMIITSTNECLQRGNRTLAIVCIGEHMVFDLYSFVCKTIFLIAIQIDRDSIINSCRTSLENVWSQLVRHEQGCQIISLDTLSTTFKYTFPKCKLYKSKAVETIFSSPAFLSTFKALSQMFPLYWECVLTGYNILFVSRNATHNAYMTIVVLSLAQRAGFAGDFRPFMSSLSTDFHTIFTPTNKVDMNWGDKIAERLKNMAGNVEAPERNTPYQLVIGATNPLCVKYRSKFEVVSYLDANLSDANSLGLSDDSVVYQKLRSPEVLTVVYSDRIKRRPIYEKWVENEVSKGISKCNGDVLMMWDVISSAYDKLTDIFLKPLEDLFEDYMLLSRTRIVADPFCQAVHPAKRTRGYDVYHVDEDFVQFITPNCFVAKVRDYKFDDPFRKLSATSLARLLKSFAMGGNFFASCVTIQKRRNHVLRDLRIEMIIQLKEVQVKHRNFLTHILNWPNMETKPAGIKEVIKELVDNLNI